MPNRKDFSKTIGLISGYFIQIKQIEQMIRTPLNGIKENLPIFQVGEVVRIDEPETIYKITNVDLGTSEVKPKQKGKVLSVSVSTAAKVVGTEWFWHVKYELYNMKGKPYAEPKHVEVLYSFDPRSPFSK